MGSEMGVDVPRRGVEARPKSWVARWPSVLIAWLIVAALMVRSWIVDPYVEPLDGIPEYGHNGPDALRHGLGWLAVELILVFSILRPWNYDRSWWRPVVALLPVVPLVGYLFVTQFHSGGIHGLHLLWAAFLMLWLFRRADVDRGDRRSERASPEPPWS